MSSLVISVFRHRADKQTDRQTDKQTPVKALPLDCRLASVSRLSKRFCAVCKWNTKRSLSWQQSHQHGLWQETQMSTNDRACVRDERFRVAKRRVRCWATTSAKPMLCHYLDTELFSLSNGVDVFVMTNDEDGLTGILILPHPRRRNCVVIWSHATSQSQSGSVSLSRRSLSAMTSSSCGSLSVNVTRLHDQQIDRPLADQWPVTAALWKVGVHYTCIGYATIARWRHSSFYQTLFSRWNIYESGRRLECLSLIRLERSNIDASMAAAVVTTDRRSMV